MQGKFQRIQRVATLQGSLQYNKKKRRGISLLLFFVSGINKYNPCGQYNLAPENHHKK
jgi:hypothetical protein